MKKKKNNSGLPDTLKSGIESLSGFSMDDVKIHYNSDKPAQLNEKETAIHLIECQAENSTQGEWHVTQPKKGRIKANKPTNSGTPINDDIGLEKEADILGSKAIKNKKPSA